MRSRVVRPGFQWPHEVLRQLRRQGKSESNADVHDDGVCSLLLMFFVNFLLGSAFRQSLSLEGSVV